MNDLSLMLMLFAIIKDIHLSTAFIIHYFFTNKCMHQDIVKSSVTSKTMHNLTHIYTSATKKTIANTIMSAV